MDLQDIKNLLAKEKNAKIIIVEDGKPIMVISGIENNETQARLTFKKQETRQENKQEEIVQAPRDEEELINDINQSTELIAREEMPVDELRVEDLPF
ncbi:hypothetical protein KKC63_02535 [Patescibacteria group bacterium]|nr:hypothetical protein [Patescibacteria group bacterium]MBU4023511.1 hypothetical protein [Patescibacteria group bacterium]MBU4078028.1 hypothetical protein [Patescibacteria group bacterium]